MAPAVQVSPSTTSSPARSLQLETWDKESWRLSWGPSQRAGKWKQWIIGMRGTAPKMKTEMCTSGTCGFSACRTVAPCTIISFHRYAFSVTGEGQKTSSVLSRALSRIEMRILAETIRLSDRSWSKAQVLLSVETEETQLGSLEDQVSSYLYYTGYAEPSTLRLPRTHL